MAKMERLKELLDKAEKISKIEKCETCQCFYGENPVLIASTAIERGLVSRLDHAAYLGREIEKAYLSIVHGYLYIQDSAQGHDDKEAK